MSEKCAAKSVRRYSAPSITSFDPAAVRELLGPVQTQYMMTTSDSSCLPLSPAIGDTVQDNWQFSLSDDPTRVTIDVDVLDTNVMCATTSAHCSSPPDPAAGPLDPKFALYPPGVIPALGTFNGYYSAADCSAPDPGCAAKPANSCIVCDSRNCTLGTARPGSCGSLDVNLTPAGYWTISVAPQAPSFVPEAQGCYVLTVTAEVGKGVTALALVDDDATVTFEPSRIRR